MSEVHVAVPAVVVRVPADHPVSPRELDAVLRARVEQSLRERANEFVTVGPAGRPLVDTAKLQALVAGAIERAVTKEGR